MLKRDISILIYHVRHFSENTALGKQFRFSCSRSGNTLLQAFPQGNGALVPLTSHTVIETHETAGN